MTSTMTTITTSNESANRGSGYREEILHALRSVFGRGVAGADETATFRLDEDEVLEQLFYGRD